MSTETSKAGPCESQIAVGELLRRFDLRPRELSGAEIDADIQIQGAPRRVFSHEANALSLTLGVAIARPCAIENVTTQRGGVLFADGESADWLEHAEPGIY